MKKNEPKNRPTSFDFDEQGFNEVSAQIMDAYNSGFIGEPQSEQNLVQISETEEI